MHNENVVVLFVADINGKSGLTIASRVLPDLIKEYSPTIVIANGENAVDGKGLTEKIAQSYFGLGINVITGGNHTWDNPGIYEIWKKNLAALRPANYPPHNPGRGGMIYNCPSGARIGIINLQGRTFMATIDCPFQKADQLIEDMRRDTKIIVVDFHAEATAEKMTMGWYLDGRVSAVIGTHTHVQTADERILPGGTAYITDAGMTGPIDSVIGMKTDVAIRRFVRQVPARYVPAEGNARLCGAVVEIDPQTGKALRIDRLSVQ
jgi:metallophosphoesterase (TIGR00282 family)